MRILVETRRKAIYLSGVILLLLMSLCGRTYAEDEEILPGRTEDPSSGCVWIGVYGDYCGDQQETLDRINQIRYEACAQGIPDPRNASRSLQLSDYVPLKWSSSLEEAARIRASEAMFVIAHERHNGKQWSSASGTVHSNAEDIAWNFGNSMVFGVEQWYEEKEEWLKEVAGEEHDVTGHYTSMINPNYRYIGVGTLCSSDGIYPNATVGELSTTTGTVDESFLPLYSDIIQKVDVSKSYLGDYTVTFPSQVSVNESREIVTKVHFTRGKYSFIVRYLGDLEYYSSNTGVAAVDSTGHIIGRNPGTVSVQVSLDGVVLGAAQITVVGGYDIADTTVTFSPERVLYNGTAKTPEVIVKNGGKKLTAGTDYTVTYSNNTAVGKATVTITGKGIYTGTKTATFEIYCNHNCNYSPVNENNQIEGDCSVCGNHVVVNVPTTFVVYWRESQTEQYINYSSILPYKNLVGSEIEFFISTMDGDEGFQDCRISYSAPSKLSGPSEVSKEKSCKLTVLGSGEVTITISPKWNPGYSRSFTLMLGNLDISKARAKTNSKTYTGNSIESLPIVYWGDRSLTKGTHYEVSYRNNVNAGMATIIITGIGDFSGTLETTFEIKPKSISGIFECPGVDATISDTISLRFYLKVSPENYGSYANIDPYVVFSVNGTTRTKQYLKDAQTVTENGVTKYIMTCPVNIKEVSDRISLKFFINDNVCSSKITYYSVKEYCEFIIDNNYSAKAKALARALLTYSAYAREYFDYKTDELTAADKPNTLSTKQTVTAAISGNISMTGSSQHVIFDGLSLMLLAETGMRFYLTPDAYLLANDTRFKTNNSGRYYIAVSNTKLGNLNSQKTVTVDGLTITASPLHYVKSVLQNSTNTKLINLCLAMYDCYTAAKAYQGQ